MSDQKIIDWLKNNSVESKEELYEQFPDAKTTLLDHHLNNIHPHIFKKENFKKEANEETNFKSQSKSLRARIIKYVCDNPEVSNKTLYEKFADQTSESTIRNYKHAALSQRDKYLEEQNLMGTHSEHGDVNKEDMGEGLEETRQEKQSQPLILEELEEKAGLTKQDNNPKNILNNNALLNQLMDAKINPLLEKISEQTESIDILTEEVDGLNKNISQIVKKQVEASLGDQLDKLIEDKINQIITRKISDIGGNLLSSLLGNLLGNANLNMSFGKK